MPGAIHLALALALAAGEPQLPPGWRPVAREILAELVAIDTTHEKGSTAAAQAIARRLRAAGWADADMALAGPVPNKQNLVVRLRGTGKAEPLLYVLHLDVVRARPEDWTVQPFALTERDGWLYGRGTSDMKGDVAAMVTTLLRLRAEGYRPGRDVVVAFTDDEETGQTETNGVRWLLANRPELVRAALAINPDAGGGDLRKGRRVLLDLQTSEKVYASFQLETTDRGGHSSIPHAGNPIYRLAAALARIAAFEFPLHLNETTRGYFAAMANGEQGALAADLAALGRVPTDPGAAARVAAASDKLAALMHTTCVATELAGGHAENALPQRARATLNCRVLPDESARDVEATLVRLVADPAVHVTAVAPAIPSPPSPLVREVTDPVEAVARAMFPGVPIAPYLSTGASDSLSLRAAGVPTYGVSGMFRDMDDVRAHGRDERIGVDAFYDGVEFSYRLMRAIAGATAPTNKPALPQPR